MPRNGAQQKRKELVAWYMIHLDRLWAMYQAYQGWYAGLEHHLVTLLTESSQLAAGRASRSPIADLHLQEFRHRWDFTMLRTIHVLRGLMCDCMNALSSIGKT